MEQVRVPLAGDPAASADSFRSAFRKIAGFLGRPSADAVLFSGVPFDDKSVTSEDVGRLSQRIGLEFSEHSRKDFLAGNAELPLLVLCGDGSALALLEVDERGRYSTGLGGHLGSWLTRREVLDRTITHILSFSVVYSNS